MSTDGSTRIEPADDRPDARRARAMLKAVGFSDADLKKPLVGVAKPWIEIGPATSTCARSRRRKDRIRDQPSGTPIEFNTVAVSDGVTMG